MTKRIFRLIAGLLAVSLAAEPALATPWRFVPLSRPSSLGTLFTQEALSGRSRQSPGSLIPRDALTRAITSEQDRMTAHAILASADRRRAHTSLEAVALIEERRTLAQEMRRRLTVLEARRLQLEPRLSPIPTGPVPPEFLEWIQSARDYVKNTQLTLRTADAFAGRNPSRLQESLKALDDLLFTLPPLLIRDVYSQKLEFRRLFGEPVHQRMQRLDIRLDQMVHPAKGNEPVRVLRPEARSPHEVLRVILFAGRDAQNGGLLQEEFVGASATRFGEEMVQMILAPERVWPQVSAKIRRELGLTDPAELRELTRRAFTQIQPKDADARAAYRTVMEAILKLGTPEIQSMARTEADEYLDSDRRPARWQESNDVLHPQFGIGIIRQSPPVTRGEDPKVIGHVRVEFSDRRVRSLPYWELKPILSQWALPIASGVDAELHALVRKDKHFVPYRERGRGLLQDYFSWDTVAQVRDRYVPRYRDPKGAWTLSRFAKAFGRSQKWILRELEAGRMEADQIVITGPHSCEVYFAYRVPPAERDQIQKLLEDGKDYGDLNIAREAGIGSRRTIWLIRTGQGGVSRLYAEKIRYALRALRKRHAFRTVSIPDEELLPLAKRLRAVIEAGISYDTLEEKSGYSRSGIHRAAYDGMGLERENAERVKRALDIVEPWIRLLTGPVRFDPRSVDQLSERLNELKLSSGQWIPRALARAIQDLLRSAKQITGYSNPKIGVAADMDRDAVRRTLKQTNIQPGTAQQLLRGIKKLLIQRVRAAWPTVVIAVSLALAFSKSPALDPYAGFSTAKVVDTTVGSLLMLWNAPVSGRAFQSPPALSAVQAQAEIDVHVQQIAALARSA